MDLSGKQSSQVALKVFSFNEAIIERLLRKGRFNGQTKKIMTSICA